MEGEGLQGREGGRECDLERTGRMGPASMGMGTRRGVFLPDSSRDGERREKRGRKVGRPAEWLMSDRLAWLALTAKRSTCLPPRSAIDHYHQTKNSFRPRRDAPDCPVSLSACLLLASGVPCAVPASVAATASPSSVPASPSRLPSGRACLPHLAVCPCRKRAAISQLAALSRGICGSDSRNNCRSRIQLAPLATIQSHQT
jgi:hypothetical protein